MSIFLFFWLLCKSIEAIWYDFDTYPPQLRASDFFVINCQGSGAVLHAFPLHVQYASGCIHPNHRSQQQLDQYVCFFSSATHDNNSDISLIIMAKGMWWNNTMPGRENIWKRHHPTVEGKDAIVWSWTTMAMPLYLKVPFFWVRAIPTLVVLTFLAFQYRSRLWPHDCCHHGWLWQRCPADLWWPLAFLQRLPKQYPPTVQIPSRTQQLAPSLTPTHTGIWLGKWMLTSLEAETTVPLMVTTSPCGSSYSMTDHVQFWDLVLCELRWRGYNVWTNTCRQAMGQ